MGSTKQAAVLGMVFLCGYCGAASVDWIDGIGAVAPSGWSISPGNPSTTSVISFKGPTDKSYGNSCAAAGAYGGSPYLAINTTAKTVELKFQGPAPSTCTMIYKPTVGLQGEFGPLAAGSWTFKCTNSHTSFTVSFTVGGGGGGGGLGTGDHIIRVDGNAPLVLAPDGSSWTKAYHNLHDGLAAAQSGDTVRVANGAYEPDDGTGVTAGDRAASFVIPDNVTVLGGYAGYGAANPDARNIDLYPTILSGDLNKDDLWGLVNLADNSFHVVTADGAGTLDGCLITAGNADGADDTGCGGGVFVRGVNLRLSACKVYGNKAHFGAGVACLAGGTPVLMNTEITGNWAYTFGGGLYNEDARTQLAGCLLTGNTAGSADLLGSDAILNAQGSLDIVNCTIADNRPGHGAPANQRTIVSLVWAPGVGDTVSIKNSIVRNGGNEVWSTEPGTVTLNYNNIEGGKGSYSGSGNIDKDPLFKNPGVFGIEGGWYFDDDGYTLRAGSASINAGNKTYVPAALLVDLSGYTRIQGGQVDQGAYETGGLPPAVVLVPNVVGQSQSTAQSLLTSAALVVGTVTEVSSDTVAAGHVISQSPVAGSTAVVGAAVDLTISRGSGGGSSWEPPDGSTWVLEGTSDLKLSIPTPPPGSPISVSSAYAWTFPFPATSEYWIEVVPVPGVGGTWTVDPATGTVSGGTHTINFTVEGVDVDVSSLSPGTQKIAEIRYYTR